MIHQAILQNKRVIYIQNKYLPILTTILILTQTIFLSPSQAFQINF